MPFWSSQRIKAEQKARSLVEPFTESRIQQGAYEMTLSREVITTPDGTSSATELGKGPVLKIPPGQFALLFTEEAVSIPAEVIAFISIKATVKLDGLVNISGFHVDPGFSGRLKFSVYNAGNLPIFLEYGKPTFLIWFAEFDSPTEDPYGGSHQGQNRITPKDRQRMAEETHSPAAIDKRLERAEGKITAMISVGLAILTLVILPILVSLIVSWLQKPNDNRAAISDTKPVPAPKVERASSPIAIPKP
jgi:dCTP deaminase